MHKDLSKLMEQFGTELKTLFNIFPLIAYFVNCKRKFLYLFYNGMDWWLSWVDDGAGELLESWYDSLFDYGFDLAPFLSKSHQLSDLDDSQRIAVALQALFNDLLFVLSKLKDYLFVVLL